MNGEMSYIAYFNPIMDKGICLRKRRNIRNQPVSILCRRGVRGRGPLRFRVDEHENGNGGTQPG